MAHFVAHNLSVNRLTKGKLPSLPFVDLRNAVFGPNYDLSIVFVNLETSQRLNRETRDKDYPTNILSFPLSKESGELVIQLSIARRDAPKFEMSYQNFLGFLLIHGLLHLKGMDHGSRMEKEEKKFTRQFNFD